MIRPSMDPSPHRRAVMRNLALDLLAAVGVGVTGALINALLPTIARRGGLEPLGLAALAAAPFIANLLGAFAGRYGPRSARQLALLRGAGAASLVLLFIWPVPAVMIAISIAFWLSLSFGGPFHLRLWGTMYPARLRGRVVGAIGMGRAAAGALAAFAGGLIADRLGGPPAVAIAGIVGLVCAIGYAGLRAHAAERPPMFSARDSIRALRERPVLGRVALAQGFYGGGLIAAAPLYALVYVDRLDLTLADVGVIGILAAVATTVSFLVWGAVADRFGALIALRIGSAVGLTALIAYALAPDVAVLWVAAVAAGAGTASIDVGIASVVSDQTTLASRSAAMAGWNAITGARGIVAAFLMSTLLQLGIVDVTTGLLLCAGTSAIGVYLFARTRAGVPVETRAWEVASPARRGGAVATVSARSS
ncbi:MAG TPA: MFS transporter [Candidatus Saccharimonadales bacterium]|nr:MFS transporter [Candidatus Saccharimonadales bacterium]